MGQESLRSKLILDRYNTPQLLDQKVGGSVSRTKIQERPVLQIRNEN
jgi:hypothetical protein